MKNYISLLSVFLILSFLSPAYGFQYDGSDTVEDKYIVDEEYAQALTAWKARTEELCGKEKTSGLKRRCKRSRRTRLYKQPFIRGTEQYFITHYKPLPTVELKRLAVKLWDLSEVLDEEGLYDEWPLGAIGSRIAINEYGFIIDELADERSVPIGVRTRFRAILGAPPKEWRK